jgi:hypothetical protein
VTFADHVVPPSTEKTKVLEGAAAAGPALNEPTPRAITPAAVALQIEARSRNRGLSMTINFLPRFTLRSRSPRGGVG